MDGISWQAKARAAQIELDSARGRGIADLLETARARNVKVVGALASLYRVAPEHDPLIRGALGPYAIDVLALVPARAVPSERDAAILHLCS